MKVFNSKLAAIGLAAFVFASCSDSNSEPGGGTTPNINTVVGTTTLVQSDAAQLAASVTNYKHSANKAKTRAIDENLFAGLTSMPKVPSDTKASRLNAATDLDGTNADGYKTVANVKNYDFTGKQINNSKLFVEGGTSVTYDNLGSNNTIYVLKGGSLKYTGTGSAIPSGNTIVVVESGAFESENDIVIDGTLYSTRALGKVVGDNNPKVQNTPQQNITINGNVYLSGYKHIVTDPNSANNGKELYEYASLRAKTLTINAGAKVNTDDRVTSTGNLILAGALHVNQTIQVSNMTIKNGGIFSSEVSAKIKNALNMESGSKMTVNHLNVTDDTYAEDGTEQVKKVPGNATLTLTGKAQIVIGDHGVLNVNVLKTDNTEKQIVLGGGADNVAVIKVNQFYYEGTGAVKCISTPSTLNQTFLLQIKECYQSGVLKDVKTISFDATVDDYDTATGGAGLVELPNHQWKLKDEYKIAEQKKLDLLTTIENEERDGQSATSIYPASNGKIYVSYHTNGKDIGGNIEVAEMNGTQLRVIQNVKQQTGTKYDFNHLNVINNKLYLAGSAKDENNPTLGGATISYVGLNDGQLDVSGGLTSVAIDNKVKGDANCVIEHGGKIVVANTKGYDILPYDLSQDQCVEAPGKAKFMAKSGNNLIGLNYKTKIEAGNDPVQGELRIFNSNDLSSVSNPIEVGTIAPNNGKNMIAVDTDGKIYVCKSAKGLMCYNADGSNAWSQEYLTPTAKNGNESVDNRQGYINGVAVDGQYVYVAAGAYGLVVLQKSTGELVARRSIGTKENSANYVAVKDGLIYVAYGQGRIQVFQLTGKNQ